MADVREVVFEHGRLRHPHEEAEGLGLEVSEVDVLSTATQELPQKAQGIVHTNNATEEDPNPEELDLLQGEDPVCGKANAHGTVSGEREGREARVWR